LTIGLGFIVTEEEYDDNLYEAVGKRRAKRLGRSLRLTTEIFGAALYNLDSASSIRISPPATVWRSLDAPPH